MELVEALPRNTIVGVSRVLADVIISVENCRD